MVKEVVITPHYPNVLRFTARALIEHSFVQNKVSPVISFIETVRYLHHTDPQELERILEELRERAKHE